MVLTSCGLVQGQLGGHPAVQGPAKPVSDQRIYQPPGMSSVYHVGRMGFCNSAEQRGLDQPMLGKAWRFRLKFV